ncbi:exodeoxyribonuclease III [bacterium]|jgi:exodeoxyribonuclease III|nr:exodeoxyribonuclease III [bacterium]MBT6832174.1 exodeoxyribonuclease III [bacterium]MBT6996380.1 exodeoxyribonuclease III [bacterium]MBT7772115.1 exodeoxyribonuclease III [bacterium]
MKIISWNVNGIRAVERKGELEKFLAAHDPDILLFQEIKSKSEQVQNLIEKYSEFQQFYHAAEKPGYAGTAIWISKNEKLKIKNEELKFHVGMPDFTDDEGRISRVSFGNFEILGVYFPNGGKSPAAWQGKLEFYEKFLAFVNKLRAAGKTVIFAGDVNCAHAPIDLARPADNDGKIGFHPDERARISKWISAGWRDVWRSKFPEKKDVYSWWHVITRARDRNVGWRLDYFFVDNSFFSKVKKIDYLTDQMGSDHCPVSLEI